MIASEGVLEYSVSLRDFAPPGRTSELTLAISSSTRRLVLSSFPPPPPLPCVSSSLATPGVAGFLDGVAAAGGLPTTVFLPLVAVFSAVRPSALGASRALKTFIAF
ncbi:hypothetical protein PLICRDRAFT_176358 [Plicaturopsis crispa FD-325 SS-3]|nr:hypothetical protein PLICRDRAFT_176358 [Plicaturopsis crispa FD-325 SS-3]